MKLIDEKGKLFGRLNIIDVGILLLILIAVVIIGKMVLPNQEQQTANGPTYKTITYDVEITNIPSSMTNVFEVGDKVFDSKNGNYLGSIKDKIVSEQTMIVVNKEKTEYVKSVVPDKKTFIITIEGNGYETDMDIFVESANVKVGKKMYIKGKGYASTGYVYGIGE